MWDPDARAGPASALRARGFIVCNAQARRSSASPGCFPPLEVGWVYDAELQGSYLLSCLAFSESLNIFNS